MGSRFSASRACRGSACDIVEGDMLPLDARRTYEILNKDCTTCYDRFVLLTTGTYRIYCRSDRYRNKNMYNVLGSNLGSGKLQPQDVDEGSIDLDQLEVALFTFDIRSRPSELENHDWIGMDIFVNSKPVSTVRCSIRGVDGGSAFSYPWILQEISEDHYFILFHANNDDGNRPLIGSWRINKADDEKYLGWKIPADKLSDVIIKPSSIPLTEGSYNIYLIGNDRKIRAIGLHNDCLVVLPYRSKPSKIAKFNFTLRTEGLHGTFVLIHTDGRLIFPCEDNRIRPMSAMSTCGDPGYAWKILQKGSCILSILSDDSNAIYPMECSWFLNTETNNKSVSPKVPLELCYIGLLSKPVLLFIKPSVI